MKLTEALDHFARDHEGLSPNTFANYRSAFASLAEAGLILTRHLRRAPLARWISLRRACDVAPATINVQLAGVLSVASHLERAGLFPLSRLLEIRRLRVPSDPIETPAFLTRDELARLRLAAIGTDPALDLAVSLAVFAGLRMNELRQLRREDLVLDGPAPFLRVVTRTKTKRPRTTPLATAYAAWLLSLRLPSAGPIFPAREASSCDGCLSRETLKTWLRNARDEAELHSVTWFVLRHTFASWCRQGGVELSKISGWMGNTVRICERHYAALGPGGDATVERGFATG